MLVAHSIAFALVLAGGAPSPSPSPTPSDAESKGRLTYVGPEPTIAPDVLLRGAIRQGDLAKVEAALAAGAKVNAGVGQSEPLTIAATRGRVDIMELLLKHGADVNGRDAFKRTPLWAAVFSGQARTWELLLAAGAEVGIVGTSGDTVLDYAVDRGQLEAVRALLAKRADPNRPSQNKLFLGEPPITRALRQNRRDIVDLLLANGARLDFRNADGQSALRAAVAGANPELVELCLSKGLDLKEPDTAGRTALMWAAQDGSKEMIAFLLGKGLDAGAKDKDGKTAADLAVGRNRDAIVELLKGGKPPAARP
jgi:cytohesin